MAVVDVEKRRGDGGPLRGDDFLRFPVLANDFLTHEAPERAETNVAAFDDTMDDATEAADFIEPPPYLRGEDDGIDGSLVVSHPLLILFSIWPVTIVMVPVVCKNHVQRRVLERRSLK